MNRTELEVKEISHLDENGDNEAFYGVEEGQVDEFLDEIDTISYDLKYAVEALESGKIQDLSSLIDDIKSSVDELLTILK